MKITRILNLSLVFVASYLVDPGLLKANQRAFAEGDASFIAFVDDNSRFLAGETTLDAVLGCGCNRTLDYVLGSSLDISRLPSSQIESVRELCREEIKRDKQNRAVIVCVCDPSFNFSLAWLGVPYSSHTSGSNGGLVANCFGPDGAAAVSAKDSQFVTALEVKTVSDRKFQLTGQASIAILNVENFVLQNIRKVVGSDGSVSKVSFDYNPRVRICFEDTDAFFVAKADALFGDQTDDAVELDYHVLPRSSTFLFSIGSGLEIVLPQQQLAKRTTDLPIADKGRRLRVHGLPKELLSVLKSRIQKSSDRPWYVFVVDRDYDPYKFGIGKRYCLAEQGEFKLRDYEYVDCNECTDTYPIGFENNIRPPILKISWEKDLAVANMQGLKLIFLQYYEGVRFKGDVDCALFQRHYQLTQTQLQEWARKEIIRDLSP